MSERPPLTTSAFKTRANRQQLEAIETTEGPLLIIAGPGSGKTFTLVERVVYLITEKGATPESLFVATFTDKAVQELRTRVSNRLNQLGIRLNLKEMYLGIFHSICLRWLRDYREHTRLKRNFILLDRFDQVVGRIGHKDFAIAERPHKHCIDCDMRFYCDRKNWTFSGSS